MCLVAVGFMFERMIPVEGQGPREPDKEDSVNIIPGVVLCMTSCFEVISSSITMGPMPA